jgi:hypothetical protein
MAGQAYLHLIRIAQAIEEKAKAANLSVRKTLSFSDVHHLIPP